MYLDENLEFADATSVGTPNSTTVNVGDVVDLGAVPGDIGAGGGLWLVVQVVTAITSGGSATVSFLLSSDSGETLAVNGDQTEHYKSDAIPVASLVAGYQLAVPLPARQPDYERYLGFQVREEAGQALNGGTVNAFLTLDPAVYTAYADGSN